MPNITFAGPNVAGFTFGINLQSYAKNINQYLTKYMNFEVCSTLDPSKKVLMILIKYFVGVSR